MQGPAFRAKAEGRDPGDRPIRLEPGFGGLPASFAMASGFPQRGRSAQELLEGTGRAPEITRVLTGVPFGSARMSDSAALQRAGEAGY